VNISTENVEAVKCYQIGIAGGAASPCIAPLCAMLADIPYIGIYYSGTSHLYKQHYIGELFRISAEAGRPSCLSTRNMGPVEPRLPIYQVQYTSLACRVWRDYTTTPLLYVLVGDCEC